MNANQFAEYLHEDIEHIYTAVDNPRLNGLNERLGQTLVNRIRRIMNEEREKKA